MSWNTSYVKFIVIILLCLILNAIMIIYYMDFPSNFSSNIIPIASDSKINNNDFEINLVNADLETYNNITSKLSSKVRGIIVSAMEKNCKKYDLPIGLLHGIFRTESEYRFYLDHAKININVHGKSISTNAIGIGGIVWEFWEEKLKLHGIAETKTDLYLPEVNIEASCYILRSIIDEEVGNSDQYNIISKIITRYYGAYSKEYFAKMQRVTSDLWMARMGKIIILQKSNLRTDSIVTLSNRVKI